MLGARDMRLIKLQLSLQFYRFMPSTTAPHRQRSSTLKQNLAVLVFGLLHWVAPAAAENRLQYSQHRFCSEQAALPSGYYACLAQKSPDHSFRTLDALREECKKRDESEAEFNACVQAHNRALTRAYQFLFPVAESLANSAAEYKDLRGWHEASKKQQFQSCAYEEQQAVQEFGGRRSSYSSTARHLCEQRGLATRLHALLTRVPQGAIKQNPVYYPQRTQPEEELLLDPLPVCSMATQDSRANGQCLAARASLMQSALYQLDAVLEVEGIRITTRTANTCREKFNTVADYVNNSRCQLHGLRQALRERLARLVDVVIR